MNTSMNGKEIRCIDLNPIWTQDGNPERIWARDGVSLTLSAMNHGDHDAFWVIQSKDGEEIARFNASGIQHIVWLR